MTTPLLDTAEECARWLGVSPHTIRSWARRGHITRYPGDRYNAVEAADYLDKRGDTNTQRARRTCGTSPQLRTLIARDASPETG